MPPSSPPTGWTVPVWFQISFLAAIALMPFITVLTVWWLKDRRSAKSQEGQALVDDQQGFIDRILKAAELAPVFMEKNQELMQRNVELQTQLSEMQKKIDLLEASVKALEADRDAWREMAKRVPNLEGQIETYSQLMKDKMAEVERLSGERDLYKRQLLQIKSGKASTEGPTTIENVDIEIMEAKT